ncbi:MAG: phosphate transport system regulatory protein PhoU, partial [Anaerolineae bacterium]|nr:phosphate transport system regulatory protein PhoU [Anaerolineae bacterium]
MMKTLTPRETFDRQLAELKDQLLVLGSMVEQMTLDAVDALKRRDIEAARNAYAYD